MQTKEAPGKGATDWGKGMRHIIDESIHGYAPLAEGEMVYTLCGSRRPYNPAISKRVPRCKVCEDLYHG